MISKKAQVVIWFFLLVLWTAISINFHPSLFIDVIVTAILLVSYALTIYLNILVLIPLLLRERGRAQYAIVLLVTMIILTFIALSAIRTAYSAFGYGAVLGDYWQNYEIDLFGMAIHLAASVLVLWIVSTRKRIPSGTG